MSVGNFSPGQSAKLRLIKKVTYHYCFNYCIHTASHTQRKIDFSCMVSLDRSSTKSIAFKVFRFPLPQSRNQYRLKKSVLSSGFY